MLSLLKQINKELEVKVIIVILGLVLGSAANAQQWFSVNANCSVNAGNIQCTACNYSYNRAISCRLDVPTIHKSAVAIIIMRRKALTNVLTRDYCGS